MHYFKIILSLLLCFYTYSCEYEAKSQQTVNIDNSIEISSSDSIVDVVITNDYSKDSIQKIITLKNQEAKTYCREKNLNSNYCFLIDMKIHSGRERFFIVDLKKDSVIKSGLVAHGCGPNPWGNDYSKTNPTFSNTPDSHLSSIGKYSIGKRGYSNWGIHVNYILRGLDETNNNARKRLIVLHGWDMVIDEETYPNGTVEGWGCPAVSNNYMTYIDSLLKKQNKPVLMWIYE